MASNIMPRIFVDHHVLMLRAGLLKEFFNAIFKSRSIVLVTGDKKCGYGHCLHGLRAMNVQFTTPRRKHLDGLPAGIKLLTTCIAGI